MGLKRTLDIHLLILFHHLFVCCTDLYDFTNASSPPHPPSKLETSQLKAYLLNSTVYPWLYWISSTCPTSHHRSILHTSSPCSLPQMADLHVFWLPAVELMGSSDKLWEGGRSGYLSPWILPSKFSRFCCVPLLKVNTAFQ